MSDARTMIAQAEGSGKLILFGEHSVVYGEQALAIPLARGLKATAYALATGQASQLSIPSLSLVLKSEPSASSSIIMIRLWRVWSICWLYAEQGLKRRGLPILPRPLVDIILEGPLPFKVGLGSSAALGIALLQVCARCLGINLDQVELNEGAWLTEEVFHGKPSGLDHTVALSSSGICFQRIPEGLKIHQIQIQAPLHIVICWTPRQGGTADAVRAVQTILERDPSKKQALSRLGMLCKKAEIQLGLASIDRDYMLASLMEEAHQALCELGVSTPALEALRTQLKQQGALGTKLTGAGFGGSVFGLFTSKLTANEVARKLKGLAITLEVN